MSAALARVKRATRNRERAQDEWREAIRAARVEGETLRRIAAVAGVTHVRVLKVVQGHEVAS